MSGEFSFGEPVRDRRDPRDSFPGDWTEYEMWLDMHSTDIEFDCEVLGVDVRNNPDAVQPVDSRDRGESFVPPW